MFQIKRETKNRQRLIINVDIDAIVDEEPESS